MKIDLNNVTTIGNQIAKLAETHQLDYIDACLLYCQQHTIEEELLGEIIKANQPLVSLIRKEAESLNFLQKQNRLQFSS